MTPESPSHCWSCTAPAPSAPAFCDGCGAVQPPGAADHFARLGIARRFDIDIAALEQRYFALQRKLHPDRFAGRPERERLLSMQQSTTLNEAYSTLGNPLRRAEYLLSLHGVTVNAETGNLPTDPEVLMEAMADREAAMDADTVAELERLAEQAQNRRADCEAGLAECFAAGDTAAAARLATRLKYLETLGSDLRSRRRLAAEAAA